MKNELADRGKYAEGEVRKVLERLKGAYASFMYERIYDARSAGGRGIPARAGDFEFWAPGLHGLIEVKELNHAFRLPSKNVTQLPKLRLRQLAGGLIFVLVYHTPLKAWRRVPVDWLHLRSGQPSWDLSDFGTLPDAEASLASLGGAVGRL
jgi:hypothetical protein